MIRRVLISVVAVALLGGCVSAGYSYRQGSGDYYHGAPSVEYRYHTPGYLGPGYGGPYPYGYYGSSPYGSYRYAYPYGYRQYYGDPYRNYYGYPYRNYSGNPYGTPYYYRRPGTRVHPQVDPTPDVNRSHWRNLDGLRRRNLVDPGESIRPRATIAPQPQPPRETPVNPASNDGGSSLGGRFRRVREAAGGDATTP